ncbi:MAG TPA: hypothetical protein VJ785_11790 [Anaerolineales bacterium]|nr:hypothetical protein [Anaerolineales bacterium]
MAGTNKDIFLARLMRERDKFELLINRIGFRRQLTVSGVLGKWSIKDILAHLLVYEQYIADRLEEILHGEPYVACRTQNALDAFLDQFGYPDLGSPLLNEAACDSWIVEKYRSVSLEEVIAQEIHAFASIADSFEKMTEEMISRHNLYERVASNTYKHYRQHINDIRSWQVANAANSKNS